MSSRKLPREHGVVLSCNHPEGCTERFQTALILIRKNRLAASKLGWRRGGPTDRGGSGARLDFCPAHAPDEKARMDAHAAAAEERKRMRDERRKAARIDPLTLTCSVCKADPQQPCIVIVKAPAGGEARAINRARKPHPERARGAAA